MILVILYILLGADFYKIWIQTVWHCNGILEGYFEKVYIYIYIYTFLKYHSRIPLQIYTFFKIPFQNTITVPNILF